MSPGIESGKIKMSSVKIPSATAGWNLDTWIYLPTWGNGPHPAIVMAHGLGCNKLLGLAPFAEAFSAAGYACVVFDYRRWGASDGTPRNSLFVAEQLEDYRTVIKYCRQQPEFDPHRVILWGYSFSGGHVLTLSGEHNLNIIATIAQSPHLGKPLGFGFNFLFFKMFALGVIDFIIQNLGFAPLYIPDAGFPGQVAALNAPGTVEGFKSVNDTPGEFPNQISASVFFRNPFHKAGRVAAPTITCPVLMIAPKLDLLCPAQPTLEVSATMSNAEVLEIPGAHFDMFAGNPDHDICLKTQLAFLAKHVPL